MMHDDTLSKLYSTNTMPLHTLDIMMGSDSVIMCLHCFKKK